MFFIVLLMKGGENMLKKIVTVIMIFALMLSLLTVNISASDIAVCDLSAATKSSTILISNNTANCLSLYFDNQKAKSVKIEQSLEKHSFLWVWEKVGGAWTKSASNTSSLSLSNTKTGLSGGKYRVKTVFTVTTSDGRTETVTVYSSEKTI